ncbi:MAG: hypothetical protein NVV73_04120 [Cellvibrionaceae bacterium]|nr:hypothetical protein [Cellvibrionaceae bacterium]
MASAQGRNAKAQRLYEEMLPEVKTINSHQVVFRNDWKDFEMPKISPRRKQSMWWFFLVLMKYFQSWLKIRGLLTRFTAL